MSHNHPIIVEWVKAYDLAVKFRDGIVSMLKDHRDAVPQLSALIEELQALDVHEIDKYGIPEMILQSKMWCWRA